ncbi:methyltransferase domain-containing protein [Radiobacillus kanasensis]|uniref:class I SAM-dependent methyltransferase n=1 Tax=Radiobacillus kanasensis TaxID=2844358 RepID=UPI001E5DFEAE|nr:class I SAM-dependent methyltransferase [Radiobacillus kanasensis]UFT98164.1 methyltransferase domain-containing protein [Radiobacillus kanasensis]
MLMKILPFAHRLLKESVHEGDVVVDATCGKGNDTLFLSQLVQKKGHVFAFDIQEAAIHQTRRLLQQHEVDHATLILDSHAQINHHLPGNTLLGGAIFNLGYLPGSDKQQITKPESTIQAMEKILERLRVHALLVIVVYSGHPGGKEEKEVVLSFVTALDQKQFAVLQYGFINQQNNPPFVLAIEKLK